MQRIKSLFYYIFHSLLANVKKKNPANVSNHSAVETIFVSLCAAPLPDALNSFLSLLNEVHSNSPEWTEVRAQFTDLIASVFDETAHNDARQLFSILFSI